MTDHLRLPDADDQGRLPRSAGTATRVASLVRRDGPLMVLDGIIATLAYVAVMVTRFDGIVPHDRWSGFWTLVPVIVAAHLASNRLCGLYGQMWKYASIEEARRLVLSGGAVVPLVGAAVVAAPGVQHPLPLSVVLFGAALSVFGFGLVRFQSRLFALRRRAAMDEASRVLVAGAGDAGATVLRDLLRSPELGLKPAGVVDDDPRKAGRRLFGVPVLGTLDQIPELVERLEIDQVLLAIPSATSELVRRVAADCKSAGVVLRVLPSVSEVLSGRVGARDIRDLRIEDLLGRQQVSVDLNAVAGILRDRRVLVTGGGGSIGSEIARQVLRFGPSRLILLDNDETHLHDVVTDLDYPDEVETVLADVRDRERVLSVLVRHKPEVVFHAAAHKHVPVLERHPREALATNVIGTANLVDAAAVVGVERFVMISTDKAIRPSSVMGASKWFAEQIVRSVQESGCRFCSVRFGNVLGSRGSVIPTFLRQIEKGGPVTVTDPAMTRYFMSIQEAVQLVLQAAALANGGEVFTLDMGEPVAIADLAEEIIRLSGRVPHRDVRIEFVGARPGEKLHEDIVDSDEEALPSSHPAIVVSRPPAPDKASLRAAIRRLEALALEDDVDVLAGAMKAMSQGPLRRAPEEVGL